MSRIDYNLSDIRAIVFDIDGVLSPSTVPVDEEGRPSRMINVKDSFAIRLSISKGLRVAIISGATDPRMHEAYSRFGVTDIFMSRPDKKSVMLRWMADASLARHEVAYVGDDIPDIPAMNCAGLRVCPADAADDVKETANYISRIPGGHGVARDLLEQILSAQDKWITQHNDYLW